MMKKMTRSLFITLWLALSLPLDLNAANVENGAKLYQTCVQCHGQDGLGIVEKKAPKLAGQFDWYLLTQLKSFKSGERKNPDMYPYIKNMSDDDFADVSAYIATMKANQ